MPARTRLRWTKPRSLLVALAAAAVLASGCGVVTKVTNAIHGVEANLQTVDAFTQNLQASPTGPFAATYATTGSTPAPLSSLQ